MAIVRLTENPFLIRKLLKFYFQSFLLGVLVRLDVYCSSLEFPFNRHEIV